MVHPEIMHESDTHQPHALAMLHRLAFLRARSCCRLGGVILQDQGCRWLEATFQAAPLHADRTSPCAPRPRAQTVTRGGTLGQCEPSRALCVVRADGCEELTAHRKTTSKTDLPRRFHGTFSVNLPRSPACRDAIGVARGRQRSESTWVPLYQPQAGCTDTGRVGLAEDAQ